MVDDVSNISTNEQNQTSVANSPVVPQSPMQSTKSGRKWLKIILIVISIIVVFVITITIIVTALTAEPAKIAQEFISYIQQGKTTEAYSLTGSQFQQVTSSDQFAAFVDQVKTKLPKSSINITSREIKTNSNGTIAIFGINLKNNNTIYYATVKLLKDGTEWKVLGFNID